MRMTRVELPSSSCSRSEGFLRLQTSSTASLMAVVPLKPPDLLLWWINRMVQGGNRRPLLLANQYMGPANSFLFSSNAEPLEHPVIESMITKAGWCFSINLTKRKYQFKSQPITTRIGSSAVRSKSCICCLTCTSDWSPFKIRTLPCLTGTMSPRIEKGSPLATCLAKVQAVIDLPSPPAPWIMTTPGLGIRSGIRYSKLRSFANRSPISISSSRCSY